jgi:MarR family transcriptional regulator, transcriptional regulator for hemolysin
MARDEKLESVLYYLIEKANKVIRRHSQEKFQAAGIDVTIDQWLAMKKIHDNESISQVELAQALFKDTASITRILDILLKKKLVRKNVGSDKRFFELSLTENGEKFVGKALGLVTDLRRQGVSGMTEKEVNQLKTLLQKVINNMH